MSQTGKLLQKHNKIPHTHIVIHTDRHKETLFWKCALDKHSKQCLTQ